MGLIRRLRDARRVRGSAHAALFEPLQRKPRLHRACAPSPKPLSDLAGTIAHRVCRHLSRQGRLEGKGESVLMTDGAGNDTAMDALWMPSISYRIATGPHAGRKAATLQTLPADADAMDGDAGQVGGLSPHAGVAAQAHERHKLVRKARRTGNGALSAHAAQTAGGRRLSAGGQDARGKIQKRARCGNAPQECARAAGGNSRAQAGDSRKRARRGAPAGRKT